MKSWSKLAVLLGAITWSGMARAQAPDATNGRPWVSDRARGEGHAGIPDRARGAGPGIRVGDFELHPGRGAEFGDDSNFFQRAGSEIERDTMGPVIDTLRLRITPSLTLRNLDRRASLAPGERGAPPKIKFQLAADAAYNEFLALDSRYTSLLIRHRRPPVGAGADLVPLPDRPC